jgi:Transposase zinc-binding domain
VRRFCDATRGARPNFAGFRVLAGRHVSRVVVGVGRPSATYEPRRAADSVLYQVVRDHYETFVAQTAAFRDGEGLPTFIDEEFRGFLRCGWLAGGFARFRCEGCRLDRLVPFSCKGRAVCPSCGGRRMAERAASPVLFEPRGNRHVRVCDRRSDTQHFVRQRHHRRVPLRGRRSVARLGAALHEAADQPANGAGWRGR